MIGYQSIQQDIDTIRDFRFAVEKMGIESNIGSSVFCKSITSFSIGETFYKFLSPVGLNRQINKKGWGCYITELFNYFGEGATWDDAEQELKLNIHIDFQRLYRKRPFEMTEDEKANWRKLCNIIDVLYYKTTTPLVVKEIGCVHFDKVNRPVRIKWITGQSYIIEPDKVPGELMSCRTGQWIEAIVKRHPITHKVLEIDSISKISFNIPRPEEAKKIYQGLPKAELETTEWDW